MQQNPQQTPPQTIIVIKKGSNDTGSRIAVGFLGCFLSLWASPLVALLTLFCFKTPLYRALLIITIGSAGLAWFISLIVPGVIFLAQLSSCSYYNTYYYGSYGYDYYTYDHCGYYRAAGGSLTSIGLFFLILSIGLIIHGSKNYRAAKKAIKNSEQLEGISTFMNQQSIPYPQQLQSPPAYTNAQVSIPVNDDGAGGCSTRNHRLSLESMAMQLNIPALLNCPSLSQAMELDYKKLKELCSDLTEEEFLRLKRYRTSDQ